MGIEDVPIIAQLGPYAVEVKPGTYFWCSCGRSGTQPFCDRSHSDCNMNPLKVSFEEEKTVYFCGCKQTGTAPYCDGGHANCPPELLGKPMK